jgi:hypothetical protein
MLYDLLNRENLDWRKLRRLTARKELNQCSKNQLSAFVIDDTKHGVVKQCLVFQVILTI